MIIQVVHKKKNSKKKIFEKKINEKLHMNYHKSLFLVFKASINNKKKQKIRALVSLVHCHN